jgi:hypothetical protein
MSRNEKLTKAALAYRDNHHWVPLRLVGKSPDCMGNGWTKRKLADPIPDFEPGDNIGILLGKPSGNLVRLDPDFQAIDAVTDALFPEPTAITGRRSSPRSGRFYVSEGIDTTNFRLPNAMRDDPRLPLHDGKRGTIVYQILGTGAQTVVPPSIHPASREEVVWVNSETKPKVLDRDDLLHRAGIEAFLMAVRQFWPLRGSRNEAAMALARVLLETLATRISSEEERIAVVDELVVAVAIAGGDGEASRDGKERAAATLEKMKAGEETIGLTRLVELLELPETVIKRFRKWLGLSVKLGLTMVGRSLPWRERSANGAPLHTMHNARLAITALGIECKYDTFHNKLLFGFRDAAVRHELQFLLGEVTDNGIICLRQLISDRIGVDLEDKATRDGVTSLALENCFDPVADMLDKAEDEWDGIERLDKMAVTYFNCEDTPLNRAIVRKTMVAAVHRVRCPGCKFDTITVLESKEGWNKSMAWRILAGDENFSDMPILGHSEREVQEQLAETWIHENADLAGMKTADIDRVKAFASRQSDDARPAYGHYLKKQKRHSIEVGTTNSSEYLPSPTGNRRFWPLKVTKTIDVKTLRRDRHQLWGEAATCEARGESIVLDEALWSIAGDEQERRRVKDPWEDVLCDMPEDVSICDEDGNETDRIRIIHCDEEMRTESVRSVDVLTHVLKVPPARQGPRDGMRLANVMKAIGWERPDSGKILLNGTWQRGYWRPWRM